jgi:chemotaxis protein CheD
VDQLFLLPGDIVVTRKPTLLTTLLGSCVSVCLSNSLQHIAGMNHYMLPEAPGSPELGHYGDTSIRKVVEAMFAFDAHPSHYRARVYGGGSIIGTPGTLGDIGARNVELARRVLAFFGLTIEQQEVGGSKGRRIRFNTQTDVIECHLVGATPTAWRAVKAK